jgi:TolB-like protein/Tfp pilus assembly protein PilF/predicted Ser/Thr protein kinase
MAQSRWHQLDALLAAALELPPGERDAFLVRACADDRGRLDFLRELLRSHEEASAALGDSAAAFAAPLLEADGLIVPGDQLGPYRVVREIGRGGMGVVYLAERADAEFTRRVAVKVVKRGMDTDEVVRRFRRERQILASLEHPNIARLYDGGVTGDGRPFLVMEYLEGVPIDRFCAERSVDQRGRLELVVTVCRAVEFAHRHLVVHRDIKPSNILVTGDGTVRLLDFGIAKLLSPESGASVQTRTGLQLLTPEYASPEQVRGGPITPRTDVHALGVLLYELLTGTRPFGAAGAAAQEIGRAVETAVPDPPSAVAPPAHPIGADLDAIVLRALEKDPADRYPSVEELAADLERWLGGKPVLAGTARRRHRRPAALRRLATFSAGGIAAVALVAAGIQRVAGRAAPAPATLAVLDLSAGPDSADAYLAAGLTEELTTRLARLRRLQVKGRYAVAAALRRADGDPEGVGRALGVRYLLEGTLGRRDSSLRLTLRLVSVEDGFQQWVEEFRFPPDRALAIQDSIVRQVGRTLGERLTALDVAGLAPRLTEHPGAYDRFLRGNYALARRTPAAVRGAIEDYAEARRLDPRFTAALARRSYAYALMADWGWSHPGLTRTGLLDQALALSEQALDEDPASADVWLARAYALATSDPVRYEGALPAFARSVALDSTNPEAWHQYAQTFMVLGHFPEALRTYRRVLELDAPLPLALVATAAIHWRERRVEEARRYLDSAVAQADGVAAPYALAVRGMFLLEQGDAAAAAADGRRSLALDSSYAIPARGTLARGLLALGDTAGAAAELARLVALVDTLHPSPTEALWLGPALADFGRREAALRLVERAEPRGAQLWFSLASPTFDRLRTEPRFQQVVRDAHPG